MYLFVLAFLASLLVNAPASAAASGGGSSAIEVRRSPKQTMHVSAMPRVVEEVGVESMLQDTHEDENEFVRKEMGRSRMMNVGRESLDIVGFGARTVWVENDATRATSGGWRARELII